MKTMIKPLVVCTLIIMSPISLLAQKQILPLKHVSTNFNFSSPQLHESILNSNCDTVNFPIPLSWSGTTYTFSNNQGYLNGTNSYGDMEKANYFDLSQTSFNYLHGTYIAFGKANTNLPLNGLKLLYLNIYEADIQSGRPSNLLYQKSFTLNYLKSLIPAGYGGLVNFPFDQPILLPTSKKIFVSVDISNFQWETTFTSMKDSIWIAGTLDGQVGEGKGTAWERWEDGEWYTYNEAYGSETNPFDIALWMFPYLSEDINGCNNSTLPFISINDVKRREDNSGRKKFDFIIKLDHESQDTVSVKYKTVEYTAKSPEDYNAVSGTLQFYPGETSKSVNVFVKGDMEIESNEYFALRLKAPVNAILADTLGLGTIKNDDGELLYAKNEVNQIMTREFSFNIYPNPLSANSAIQIQLPQQSKVSVQVVSMDGKLLRSIDKGTLNQGTYTIPLNMVSSAKGSYLVKLVVDGKTYTKTIIK